MRIRTKLAIFCVTATATAGLVIGFMDDARKFGAILAVGVWFVCLILSIMEIVEHAVDEETERLINERRRK